MATQLYLINSLFAQKQKLPVFFAANELVHTNKATYLYGQGTLETTKHGLCCVCGRTLTHPVSVKLGIGPECGSHYWDWNAVGGYDIENIERLKEEMKIKIANFKVDGWIPNTCIKQILPSTEKILTPLDHPMLIPKEKPLNIASLIDGKIKITFPYNPELVMKIKSLPDRKFNMEGKYWTIPATLYGTKTLIDWGFILDTNLQQFYDKKTAPIQSVEFIPGLKGVLFPFQKDGVSFI